MRLEHLIKDPKELEIFQKYKGQKGQFQIVAFSNEIGIDVEQDRLGYGISGKLTKNEDGKFVITVNFRDDIRSQLMAMIRQLSNYFRHKEYFETNRILEEVEYFD